MQAKTSAISRNYNINSTQFKANGYGNYNYNQNVYTLSSSNFSSFCICVISFTYQASSWLSNLDIICNDIRYMESNNYGVDDNGGIVFALFSKPLGVIGIEYRSNIHYALECNYEDVSNVEIRFDCSCKEEHYSSSIYLSLNMNIKMIYW